MTYDMQRTAAAAAGVRMVQALGGDKSSVVVLCQIMFEEICKW